MCDFNADLKEKDKKKKKSLGSVPTTSFKVQNLCLLLNKKCMLAAKFQLKSSQKLSGRKKRNVLQIVFVIVKIIIKKRQRKKRRKKPPNPRKN